MRRLAGLVTIALLAGAVAACQAAPATPQRTSTNSLATWSAIMREARDLGPVPPDQRVHVDVALRPPHGDADQAAIQAMYDPASPDFGRYVSPADYAARYGIAAAGVEPLRSALRDMGLELSWRAGATQASILGPAGLVERRFGVSLHRYKFQDGRTFYASLGAPTLPATIAGAVYPLPRVTDFQAPIVPADRFGGNVTPALAPKAGVNPAQLAQAYDIQPLHAAGFDGTGETVAIWADNISFKQADIDAFDQAFGLPMAQIKTVGPGESGEYAGDMEVTMDVEAVRAVAPGATIVVYTLPSGEMNPVTATQQMVSDNPGAIISESIGGCEADSPIQSFHQVTNQAAQTGNTIFFSSGDNGGYDCVDPRTNQPPTDDSIGVEWPAVEPGVTGCGGTTLSLTANGGWHGEAVWLNATDFEGSGGGVSKLVARPSWQSVFGVDNKYNPDKMRSVPDVSAIGDPATGLAMAFQGQWTTGGGTSLAAPLWAGMTAVVNQYVKKNGGKGVGFFNPTLYAVGGSHTEPYPPFHNITVGGNFVYPATPGYNLPTGLGTPDLYNLARDVLQYQKKGGHAG